MHRELLKQRLIFVAIMVVIAGGSYAGWRLMQPPSNRMPKNYRQGVISVYPPETYWNAKKVTIGTAFTLQKGEFVNQDGRLLSIASFSTSCQTYTEHCAHGTKVLLSWTDDDVMDIAESTTNQAPIYPATVYHVLDTDGSSWAKIVIDS